MVFWQRPAIEPEAATLVNVIHRLLLGYLFLSLSMAVHAAGDFWVLGSYSTRAAAAAEALRLAPLLATDLAVVNGQIEGRAVYRVTLDYHLFERELVLPRLTAAGVVPWRITLHDDVAMTVLPGITQHARNAPLPGEGAYLLVTSVRDIQASIDTELALGRIVSGVVSESRLEQGDIVHRVMVGPIQGSDLDTIRSRLAAAGYIDLPLVTRLSPVQGSGRGFVYLVNLPGTRASSAKARAPMDEEGRSPAKGQYNFARLRSSPKDKK